MSVNSVNCLDTWNCLIIQGQRITQTSWKGGRERNHPELREFALGVFAGGALGRQLLLQRLCLLRSIPCILCKPLHLCTKHLL